MGDYRPKIEHRLAQRLARICLLLLVALFQTALAPSLWYFRIDWVLVVVVCWGLLRGFAAGVRWSIYGGVALDILSPLPVGSHLLGLLLSVTTVAVATDHFSRDHYILPTLSVLGVSLLYGVVLAAVMAATGRPVLWPRYPATVLAPSALANGAVALPIYLLLGRFSRRDRPVIGFGS